MKDYANRSLRVAVRRESFSNDELGLVPTVALPTMFSVADRLSVQPMAWDAGLQIFLRFSDSVRSINRIVLDQPFGGRRTIRQCGVACVVAVPGLSAECPGQTLSLTGETVLLPIASEGMAIVLRHLLHNTAEHGARHVTLSASAGEGGVTLDISDDGRGVSPGNEAKIFEPFFTTRREVGGTGMGLTVVRNLLAAHRAGITLLSGQPTRFHIVFHAALTD